MARNFLSFDIVKNKNLINWTGARVLSYSINNTIFLNSKPYTDRPSDSKRNFLRETRSKTRDFIIRAAGAPDRSHQYLRKIWISHLFPANATLVFARSIVRAPLTPSTLSPVFPPFPFRDLLRFSLLFHLSFYSLSLSLSASLTRREDYWISCHFQKKYALFTLPCYEHASTRPGCGRRNKKYTGSSNEPSPSLTYVLAKSTARYFVAIATSLFLSLSVESRERRLRPNTWSQPRIDLFVETRDSGTNEIWYYFSWNVSIGKRKMLYLMMRLIFLSIAWWKVTYCRVVFGLKAKKDCKILWCMKDRLGFCDPITKHFFVKIRHTFDKNLPIFVWIV